MYNEEAFFKSLHYVREPGPARENKEHTSYRTTISMATRLTSEVCDVTMKSAVVGKK